MCAELLEFLSGKHDSNITYSQVRPNKSKDFVSEIHKEWSGNKGQNR